VDLPKCPLTLCPDGLRDMTAEEEPDIGGIFIPCGPGELDEWIGRTGCQLCHNARYSKLTIRERERLVGNRLGSMEGWRSARFRSSGACRSSHRLTSVSRIRSFRAIHRRILSDGR